MSIFFRSADKISTSHNAMFIANRATTNYAQIFRFAVFTTRAECAPFSTGGFNSFGLNSTGSALLKKINEIFCTVSVRFDCININDAQKHFYVIFIDFFINK